ncbi:MAG TPA: HNH endonuclease [Rhizobiaceae bacterium]|nr:HNH endonuclease [Rhizobiaceae bacterium]
MAVTQGHGNPPWTRDEVLLALELYLDTPSAIPGPSDPRVEKLSSTLQRLPYHLDAARQPRFRNAAGVAFKLQNLRQVATGKGLGNVSKTDREVWADFGDRPDEVRHIAAMIRAELSTDEAAAGQVVDEEMDEEFVEGRLLTRKHLVRERNRKLRSKLLASKGSSGLRCDACDRDYHEVPEVLRPSVFEAHHIVPVHAAGERKTRVQDLALLCACCHRLIHRVISREKRWVTVAEFADMIA